MCCYQIRQRWIGKGREGKGREGKGRDGMGRYGKGREGGVLLLRKCRFFAAYKHKVGKCVGLVI